MNQKEKCICEEIWRRKMYEENEWLCFAYKLSVKYVFINKCKTTTMHVNSNVSLSKTEYTIVTKLDKWFEILPEY